MRASGRFNKNIFWTGGILFLCCGGTNAAAQQTAEVSTDKILEFSLMGLRDSAQKVAEKKEWLSASIRDLREKNEELQREMLSLESRKEQLSRLVDQKRRLPSAQEKLKRWQDQRADMELFLNQLTLDSRDAAVQVDIKRKRQESAQQDIKGLETEISALKSQFNIFETEFKNGVFPQEMKDLQASVTQSRRNAALLQKKLREREARENKPWKILQSLQQEQNALSFDLNLLQEESRLAEQNGEEIQKEIEALSQVHQGELSRLDQEIGMLQSREGELKGILAEAGAKLMDKPLNLTELQRQTEELEKNLGVIRKENDILKQDLASLENNLRETESR